MGKIAKMCNAKARVCVGFHVDGAGSASVDKIGVLGGRVARRSLLSGTLGGRALMIGFYSSFGSVVNEMR